MYFQIFIRLCALCTTYIRTAAAENFDPALADPRGNITCVGDSYDLELPVLGYFNPNGLTMQQLCAKPQYGGGLPGQHVGGWCEHWLLDRGGPSMPPMNLAFDISPAARVNQVLTNPRVLLACTYRCYCNYNVAPHAAHQPGIMPAAHQYERTFRTASNRTHEILEEVVDDFETSWIQAAGPWFESVRRAVGPFSTRPVGWPARFPVPFRPMGSLNIEPPPLWKGGQGDRKVDVARIAIRNQSWVAIPNVRVTSQIHRQSFTLDVSHHVTNDIECRGRVPSFPLPGPYDQTAFATLQQFCAVQMGGGSRAANAGGYCHMGIDPTTDDLTRTVWFSDEFTPRREWTWSGGNFLASVAIRTYCWRRCACAFRPTQENLTTSVFGLGVWPLLEDIYIAESPDDGSMVLQNWNSQMSLLQILPAQPPANRLGGPAPAAGTCGVDGKRFCEIPWPVEILGSRIPRAPPNSSQVVKPAAAAAAAAAAPRNFTECGRYCSRHRDCSKSAGAGEAVDENDCFCGVPTPEDGRRLGLDIIAPVPVCLVLAHLVVDGLSGRDIGRSFVDQRGVPYQCPCNSTYISNACCGNEDGMVWTD